MGRPSPQSMSWVKDMKGLPPHRFAESSQVRFTHFLVHGRVFLKGHDWLQRVWQRLA